MNGQWSLPIPPRRFFSEANKVFAPFDGVNHAVYLSWIEILGLDYNENGIMSGSIGHIRDHYNRFVRAKTYIADYGPNVEGIFFSRRFEDWDKLHERL